MKYCRICGKPDCKEHSFFIGKTASIREFSGSSPPEIFVGRYGYPDVNAGILSPIGYGNTQIMSSPEEWHKKQLSIPDITSLRSRLIYGRAKTNVRMPTAKFINTMQEIAISQKSVSAEFMLKKPITAHREQDSRIPLISNTAQVESVRLQENPKVLLKVDKLTNDTDLKSTEAIKELYNSSISVSDIIKILSAGLLGTKTGRKLVPTRWAITAVDDTLSKNKLEKIRYYNEIPDISVFNSEYLGNHYEFLLLPDKWSFEVIEISISKEVDSKKQLSVLHWQDYEGFFPRKNYAKSVTGAYYANRLAVAEYLERIQRQASCIVIREILPKYNAPLGVGILREASRQAFKSPAQKYGTLKEALNKIQTRLKQPITNYTNQSKILKDFGKQVRLNKFF